MKTIRKRLVLTLFVVPLAAIVSVPIANAKGPNYYKVGLLKPHKWGFGTCLDTFYAMGPNHTCGSVTYARTVRLLFIRIGVFPDSGNSDRPF